MKKDHTYKHSIAWQKSKEEVWADIAVIIARKDASAGTPRTLVPSSRLLAIAASFTLLLAISGFMRFHTLEMHAPEGEHMSATLPDGSTVELNSNTSLSYHPQWWRFSRTAQLEGEAWFLVKKGSKFVVKSALAQTEVLGTSFNVFARDDRYHVSCHSGTVSVSSRQTKDIAVLDPGRKAVLSRTGTLSVYPMSYRGDTPVWVNPMLMYISTPLGLVFDEIEQKYSIEIDYSQIQEHLYSGNFPADTPLENMLSLLCRPFNLSYELSSGNKYLIISAPPE